MRHVLHRVRRNPLVELVVLTVLALLLAFVVQAYAIKPYRIPSGSMQPTLDIGQRVLVNRAAHRLGSTPGVGDVIVFHPPRGAADESCAGRDQGGGTSTLCAVPARRAGSEAYIKRVVGVAGDRITLRHGHVVRNGRRAAEPFTRPCVGGDCTFADTITVPRGTVYVLGDNRGNSDDGRFWGPVRLEWVVGRAFATYWPPKRIGGL